MREDQFRILPVHRDTDGVYVILPARSFALAHSVEHIKLPRNLTALVTNKSTPARGGLNNSTTVGEAGWSGFYTWELVNLLPVPQRLYIGEGVAQILFLRGNPPRTSYADRQGKYQDQAGLTLPMVDR